MFLYIWLIFYRGFRCRRNNFFIKLQPFQCKVIKIPLVIKIPFCWNLIEERPHKPAKLCDLDLAANNNENFCIRDDTSTQKRLPKSLVCNHELPCAAKNKLFYRRLKTARKLTSLLYNERLDWIPSLRTKSI